MSAGNWLRVSRERPCPVCGRPDWCVVSRDGGASICQRTESSKRCGEAGYLHLLRAPGERREPVRRVTIRAPREPTRDWAALAAEYRAAVNPVALVRFADGLGVSRAALLRMGIGQTQRGAWALPHTDGAGRVCGIHLRLPDGRKPYVRGSTPGVAAPSDLGACDPLIVAEGESDCAAALTLGLDAVARPGCGSATQALCRFIRSRGAKSVVVFGDADDAGRRGATALATTLCLLVPRVRVALPPPDAKDLRGWLIAGATRGDVERVMEAAEKMELKITTRRTG